jgi:hypothetical protein
MARVSRPRTTTTRRSTSTSATTSTNRTTNTGSSSTGATQPPVPSGAQGRAPKATINGLKGMTTRFDTFATTRGSDSGFNTNTTGSGAVSRGYIKCSSQPIQNGCRLTVDTFHADQDDKMTLILMAEVLDTKTNELRTVNLSVLANGENINKKSYRGSRSYDISYADVNKYLQKFNPSLQVTPGTTNLSVMAFWNGSGGSVRHRAGGPARGGMFRLPAPLGGSSPLATRINATTGAANSEDTPLPLDMQVAYPDNLTRSMTALKPDGNILSRLESEFKGGSDAKTMKKAVHSMYDMVEKIQQGDKSDVEQLLGKDWTIHTVTRYWLKDDGAPGAPGKAGTGFFKGFRVDDDGLPIQDPMRDKYMDDARLGMTHHAGAIRLRKNKQATVINVKPGEGRLDDKTGIRQRIEVGIELKPEASAQDAREILEGLGNDSGRWNDTIFNHAENQVHELDEDLDLSKALDPWLDVTQDRHKFTIKNEKTGVEIEFSFDFVKAKTLRPEHVDDNGKPLEVEFAVLEGELDHLQLNSTNQAATADGAGTGSFSTDSSQERWLSSTSAEVTMDVDPRLHELQDLENKAFRQTGSYKAFEGVNDKLLKALFPAGLSEAHQKAAHAANLLGLVPPTQDVIRRKIKHFTENSGIKWTPELDKFVQQIAKDPATIEKMDRLLYDATPDIDGDTPDVVQALRAIGGVLTPDLEYDAPTLVAKVTRDLEKKGLDMTQEVKDALSQLTVKQMRPGQIEDMLTDLDSKGLGEIFQPLANELGLAHVPEPKIDFTGMKDEIAGYLKKEMIDPDFASKYCKALNAEAKGGWDLSDCWYNINDLKGGYASSALSDVGLDDAPIDKDAFRAEAGAHLAKSGVTWNGSIERFVNKVAKDYDFSDAKDWLDELRYDYEDALESAASNMGASEPKLTYNLAKLDSDFGPQLAGGYINYTGELQTLTHELLEHGAKLSQVKRFISHVASGNEPKSALSRYSLKAPRGVTVPDRKVDPTLADGDLAQAASEGFFAYDAAVQAMAHAVIDGGAKPSDVIGALKTAHQYKSLDEALKDYGVKVPDGTTVPGRTLDVAGAIGEIENRLNDTLDDKVRKYLEKALPVAFAADDFVLNDVFSSSRTLAKKLDYVEKHSKLDRPSLR